jgi:hypothetical protein
MALTPRIFLIVTQIVYAQTGGGGYGGGGSQGVDLSKGYWEKIITYNGSLSVNGIKNGMPNVSYTTQWTKFGPDERYTVCGPGDDITLTTSGNIHFKFQWIPGPNNLSAPKKVLLSESGSANAISPLHNLECKSKVTIEGVVYNGIQPPPINPGDPPIRDQKTITKTVWILKDVPVNGIIEFDISPSADVHCKAVSGDPLSEGPTGISYGAGAGLWNVQIDLRGTTPDATKKLRLLTGQACQPNLAMPGNVKELAISRRDNMDSWQSITAPSIKVLNNKSQIDWDITGSGVFKKFNVNLPNAGMVNLAPSDKLKILSPQFFDRKAETVNVKCLAVTLNIDSTDADIRAPLPTLTNIDAPELKSDKPQCLADIKRGWVQISSPLGNSYNNGGSFAHNGISNTVTTQGENWQHVKFVILPPFTPNFGSGCFGQLITFDRELLRSVTTDIFGNALFPPRFIHPANGLIGLDWGFPYGLASGNVIGEGVPPLAGTWNLPLLGFGGDSPRQGLGQMVADGGGGNWYRSSASDSLSTWIFFNPPSVEGLPTEWIPMQTYSWTWSGVATRDLVPLTPWVLSAASPAGPGISALDLWTNTDDFPSWVRFHTSPFTLVPAN